MVDVRANVTRELEHDEGELNSEDESPESSSEGFTTDGEEDSNEDDQSDKRQSSTEETPWERGLRLARERAKKAKLLRQSDVDLEDKKLNFTVVAPDPNEDDAYADICDIGRSSLSDTFWVNYHKLAIIGSTQLTCKRSLPCDLSPPSQRTMARWRRRVSDARARSSDASVASPSPSSSSSPSTASSLVTSNYGSRASSLSSIAGSILLAVPDLVLAHDSDREEQRRRRHRSGGGRRGSSSRGSSSSSSGSSSGSGSRSDRRASSSRSTSRSSSKANRKNQHRKEGRGVYSASSSSSSPSPPPAAPNAYLRARSRLSGNDEGSTTPPRSKDEDRTVKNRRPPVVSYGNHCHPPGLAAPQISGYHYQQSNFSRSAFRDTEDGSNYSNRHSYGDSSRWYESSNRSPDRPPPMPSERPVKRPWVAEPPKSRGSQMRQRSPLQPAHQRSRSRRSRSRSRSASRGSSPRDNGTGLATYITSWSQSRGRQHTSRPALPDAASSPTMSSPPRKRPASSRRKSRSPFADSYFGNPPAPAEVPFEQSVPLLAGAVNPAAPPPSVAANNKALPSVSARPGVKLKIAPRVRGGLVLPESALERAHRDNDYKIGGSPVSSASSGGVVVGRGVRSGSLSPARRDKPGLASLSTAKRMRHLGYTAVSPGGFESPPPPPITSPPSSAAPARSYSRSRRFEADEAASRARNRAPDQGRFDGHRSRAVGDYHNRADRFSRSGQLHPLTERYRDRRPPPPERFDRRMADRRIPSYDRGRSGRDYFGDSRYGRSRGENRDTSRSYVSGRHGGTSRRQSNAGRSRSPFEGRSSGGGGHFHSDAATEQRLNELRRRLIMVDDKIAELGGAPVSERR